jgi:hypothetical protein
MTTRLSSAAIAITILIATGQPALAQDLRLPFRPRQQTAAMNQRVNGQSSNELEAHHGPWLIMCASFVGPDGDRHAQQFAAELKQNKFQAYIFRQSFDYSRTIPGIGWEVYNDGGRDNIRPQTMKALGDDSIEEIAVLVGDFASVDDPRAQRSLERIKQFQSKSLANLNAGEVLPQTGGSRDLATRVSRDSEGQSQQSLRAAFLMPNPKLPGEFFNDKSIDRFVEKMNRDVQFSLLKCPGAYSIKVATLRGDSTMNPREIQDLENDQVWRLSTGNPISDSRLAKAAADANKLTEALRKKGIEAYEFHNRTESIVCIGSFDWITRIENGTRQVHPQAARIFSAFQVDSLNVPGLPNAIKPKSLKGIAFDPIPVPIEIPKSIVSYRR